MKYIYTICCILLLSLPALYSQEETEGARRTTTHFHNSDLDKTSAADDYISLYQKYISGNRGSSCKMYPSCSTFGLKIFKETNFANAMLLTSERLMRCGHEYQYYPITAQQNDYKLLDFPSYTTNPDSLIYNPKEKLFAYAESKNYNDSSILFVRHLINNSFYSEALLEINRLEFLSKRKDTELLMNKLICLRNLDRSETEVFEYETLFQFEVKKNYDVALKAALIYYELKNHTASNLILTQMDTTINTQKRIKKEQLQALNYVHLNNWEEAKDIFKKVNSEIAPNEQLLQKNLNLIFEAQNFKEKKSSTASLLSIIPGLGYVYTKHKQTALTAFVVNGLLAYATYNSVKKENYGMAALTGIFGVSFYVGNILGAGKSATRYNEAKKRTIIQTLEYYNLTN